MALSGINKCSATYNQKVLSILRSKSPAHADELNAHGTQRGWWDLCSYFRVMYKRPEEAAREIMKVSL